MNSKQLSEAQEKYGSKIIAQVIRIPDEHTVIVSANKNEVSPGDSLQIYEYLGELIGPDGKNYGSLEYVKASIEVVRCEPKYSICKTEKVIVSTDLSLALSPLLTKTTRYRDLPVDKADLNPLKPQDTKVRLGDPVKRA